MFTGIVQAVGRVVALQPRGRDGRLRFSAGSLNVQDLQPGDSMAVNGVCLTVIERSGDILAADVSTETLERTTLGELGPDKPVNLEPPLTLATPLGGHLVSGHVDGTGTVRERQEEARSVRFSIEVPPQLAKYVAQKGSICIDGVSLTVNAVRGAVFDVNIVPHTLSATTFGRFEPGRRVNLEVDIIARYLERLMLGERAATPVPSTQSET
jgi:riboflavin synthase